MLRYIWDTLKRWLRRMTFSGTISFGISAYYMYKVLAYSIEDVSLDVLKKSVDGNLISEFAYIGETAFFKGFLSPKWYMTRLTSGVSRDQLMTYAGKNPSTLLSDVGRDLDWGDLLLAGMLD
jgi:hypothetical protein